jgi:hypothetical protein
MGWTCSWNKEKNAYVQDSLEVAAWKISGRWLNKTTLKSCCIVGHRIMCILIPN